MQRNLPPEEIEIQYSWYRMQQLELGIAMFKQELRKLSNKFDIRRNTVASAEYNTVSYE